MRVFSAVKQPLELCEPISLGWLVNCRYEAAGQTDPKNISQSEIHVGSSRSEFLGWLVAWQRRPEDAPHESELFPSSESTYPTANVPKRTNS